MTDAPPIPLTELTPGEFECLRPQVERLALERRVREFNMIELAAAQEMDAGDGGGRRTGDSRT